MTPFQQYLSAVMTDDDISYCLEEAAKLESFQPWTSDTEPDPRWPVSCWLDVVMADVYHQIQHNRAQYCAQMD